MTPAPIIYFAAAAQHSWCSWLEGLHVLESYANHLGPEGRETDALSRYRETFASMVLDPGAYGNMTARRAGRPDVVTLEGYCGFASKHGEFYEWCASFDDIEGGAEGNLRNWEVCKRASIPRLMPVFHQGEPLDLLREYVRGSKYVGLGFQRPIKNEAAWLDTCFQEIPEGTWVHGFAMTNYLRWPFRSADSKTWLHEVLAMESESGQGKSALADLTKKELLDIVVKSFQRRWRRDLWRGVIGVAAGRGEQLDLEGTT
jgi:hypothetical protein